MRYPGFSGKGKEVFMGVNTHGDYQKLEKIENAPREVPMSGFKSHFKVWHLPLIKISKNITPTLPSPLKEEDIPFLI
jgi:hypothetical protein